VPDNSPLVGVIMGSKSDWPTMQLASRQLQEFGVPHESRVVSAHRTPQWMAEYARSSESRGLKLIIAGAGGAAHLPGMMASMTRLPVLGVPIASRHLNGLDSLLSIVQMPAGVPVGTLAIGDSGARNAALLAIRVLANEDSEIRQRLDNFIQQQTANVMQETSL
jgi:5-(carboxyamino)imidazole ribonucleotide mutase